MLLLQFCSLLLSLLVSTEEVSSSSYSMGMWFSSALRRIQCQSLCLFRPISECGREYFDCLNKLSAAKPGGKDFYYDDYYDETDEISELNDDANERTASECPTCGIYPGGTSDDGKMRPRIINGREPDLHRPWLAHIGILDDLGMRLTCTGSLVSTTSVLTAAHCFCAPAIGEVKCSKEHKGKPKAVPASRISLRAGSKNFLEGKELPVDSAIVHPDHVTGSHLDFAVIRLTRPIAPSATINTICLPVRSTDAKMGELVTTAGWGHRRSRGSMHSTCTTDQFGPSTLKECLGRCRRSPGPPVDIRCQEFFARAGGLDEKDTIYEVVSLGSNPATIMCYRNITRDWCYAPRDNVTIGIGVSWGFCMPSCKYKEFQGYSVAHEVELNIVPPEECWPQYPDYPDQSLEICVAKRIPRPDIVRVEEMVDGGYAITEVKTKREIEAKYGFWDTCQGDSGGPLWTDSVDSCGKRSATLVGTVSRGYDCGQPDSPAVYERVFESREWIEKQAMANSK